MSVKIEILDYVYGGGENLADATTYTSSTALMFSIIDSTTVETFAAGAVGVGYVGNICPVIVGLEYKVSFVISNYAGTQPMGFGTSGVGLPLTLRGSSNGTYTDTFVATSNGGLDLFAYSTNSGLIKNISVQRTNQIDWDKSIVGELDVTEHSDFPLALTFQLSGSKDITSTGGDYSKTFKVPATKNNNQLLKHIYIPSSITDNMVTSMKSCRIIANGLKSLVGLIQVTGAGGNGETASHYNCTFLGNNLGWASGLHEKYMNNILWGDDSLGLEYKKTNIVATWEDEDCTSSTSDIVYPVTSYGDYNQDGQVQTMQLLDTALDTGYGSGLGYFGFNNSEVSYGTPPPASDWRPAVFVKNTIDKIFKPLGYSVSSTFMNTPMFKKLVWLLPNFQYNNPAERYNDYSIESKFTNGVTMTVPRNPLFGVEIFPQITEDGVQMFENLSFCQACSFNYYWNGAGQPVLDIQSSNLTVNLDNGSYVDMANNYVTIGEYGYYKISLSGLKSKVARVFKSGSTSVVINQVNTKVAVEVQTIGQTYWNPIASSEENVLNVQTSVDDTSSGSSPEIDISSFDHAVYLNKGDRVRIRLGLRIWSYSNKYQDFLTWVFFKSDSSSHFDITLEPNDVAYGQTYDLDKVMSTQDKQIDFIKGVIHAFNLNLTTDEVNKTIYIEPFNDFYNPYSDAIDWTHKIDRSKEVSDKWIKTDLKRKLIFKYKSDGSDAKVKYRGEIYFDGVEDEYPYREELPLTFEIGERIFKNPFFAGTYSGKDRDTTQSLNTAYSACLWTEEVSSNTLDRPEKGYGFLPRLLYWNKYSPATAINNDKRARVQTWSSTIKQIVAKASLTVGGSLLSNIYPQATMTNRDSEASPNLAYGSIVVSDYNDATGVYSPSKTVGGLYDTYYKDMIEMLKQNPRIRTAYVDLKINDISKLDFRNLVYMDGVYWRASRVLDYKPNRNESTKVELIEWFGLGSSAANTPFFSGNTSQFGNSNITSNPQITL